MNEFMRKLLQIYLCLLREYGPQGWWPLLDFKGNNPTKTGSIRGYHPGDYSFPKTEKQKFEICIGAILTQNTAWQNVEKALINLKKIGALTPQKIIKIEIEKLKKAIRPAGYYNQKAKKLKEFSGFFIKLKGKTPTREQLLKVWGIGNETADSILLYAYKIPVFVVDAYTRRIFSKLGYFKKDNDYYEIRRFFEKNLPKDYKIYQEFHALIVEHAKRHYNRKMQGSSCFLNKIKSKKI